MPSTPATSPSTPTPKPRLRTASLLLLLLLCCALHFNSMREFALFVTFAASSLLVRLGAGLERRLCWRYHRTRVS